MNERELRAIAPGDDDPANLDALAERLTLAGFDVTKARGGADTLKHLDDSWPDLVALDPMMLGVNGQTVAARIKSRADIPILVLSAVAAAHAKAHFAQTNRLTVEAGRADHFVMAAAGRSF